MVIETESHKKSFRPEGLTELPQRRPLRERGYILLALLLAVALLSIGFLQLVDNIAFQVRRDREEEMIHRGVQYSRAVRLYVSKLGRYPSSIEDLEGTNNIRFLRKRYQDPITGNDFKILHQSDLLLSSIPGGSLVPVANSEENPESVPGDPNDPDQTGRSDSGPPVNARGNAAPSEPDQPVLNPDSNQASSAQPSSKPATSTAPPQIPSGEAIVGVVSLSRAKSIRRFNQKDRYNQWQFIYDPVTDRAPQKAPYQPQPAGIGSSAQAQATGTEQPAAPIQQ